MQDKILTLLFINIGSVFLFAMLYLGPFGVMLSDDIEIYHGKNLARHRWKLSKGNFLSKLLYLEHRKHLVKWHYYLFICFLVSYIAFVVCFNIMIFVFTETLQIISLILSTICCVTVGISFSVRWYLYSGNIVRRRPKKKKRLK